MLNCIALVHTWILRYLNWRSRNIQYDIVYNKLRSCEATWAVAKKLGPEQMWWLVVDDLHLTCIFTVSCILTCRSSYFRTGFQQTTAFNGNHKTTTTTTFSTFVQNQYTAGGKSWQDNIPRRHKSYRWYEIEKLLKFSY